MMLTVIWFAKYIFDLNMTNLIEMIQYLSEKIPLLLIAIFEIEYYIQRFCLVKV